MSASGKGRNVHVHASMHVGQNGLYKRESQGWLDVEEEVEEAVRAS